MKRAAATTSRTRDQGNQKPRVPKLNLKKHKKNSQQPIQCVSSLKDRLAPSYIHSFTDSVHSFPYVIYPITMTTNALQISTKSILKPI